MKRYLKTALALSILPQIIIVKWLGRYPEFVEHWYSNGLYHYLAKGFRFAFGWIPVSVGDLFYTIASVLMLRFLFLIVKRRSIIKKPLYVFREIAIVISLAYFVFHLFWGMNYYRQPIHKTLGINATYTIEELFQFTEKLIAKTNATQVKITGNDTLPVELPYTKKAAFKIIPEGFQKLERVIPELAYRPKSIKTSIYSLALTYMGYSGYLNPFTNEAQVNGLLPDFKFPVVSCHEAAHQLGYAAENEANFIGYLAAIHNSDMHFNYSAYSSALKYCLRELGIRAPEKANALYKKINKGVMKNYIASEEFWRAYQNNAEAVFKDSFNTFLKLNNQAAGIKSYNYMVPLLINYHKEAPF